jgi:hypothetical protein
MSPAEKLQLKIFYLQAKCHYKLKKFQFSSNYLYSIQFNLLFNTKYFLAYFKLALYYFQFE